MKLKVPQEKIKTILDLYTSGLSTVNIGKIFNVSYNCIRTILLKNGIVLRNSSDSKKKYSLNENYFSFIDSHEKAYFVGFLYADGYNNTEKGVVKLCLAEQDKKILEILRSELQTDKPLYEKKQKNKNSQTQYSLDIISKKISKDLEGFGLTKAKTFTITFPKWINDKFLNSFILGYFDGDGSISIQKNRYNKGNLSIVGTLEFIEAIEVILKEKLNVNVYINKRHIERNNNIFTLNICGNLQILRFLDWIYSDCKFFLERKKEKYLLLKFDNDIRNIKKTISKNKIILNEKHAKEKLEEIKKQILKTENIVLTLYNSGLSQRKINEKTQIDRRIISKIIKNAR